MYTNILHATDLREDHMSMCQKAVKIAKSFNAKLYLLHVIEPPSTLQLAQGLGFAEYDINPIKSEAEAVLQTLGEALHLPKKQQFIEVGSIKEHVLKKVQELNCDLIIVGRHRPSNIPLFLGSTAHAVIHKALCDVLTLS